MNQERILVRLLVLACAAVLTAGPLAAQAPRTEYDGAAALGLDLRRLGQTKRVLMIGAHPDDESTQILSTFALGQGADVAYLSLTRGEGGQNGIGPELQEGLGLLRSEELLAARRLDGARQYFTRAYDYGFSKSAEEAFAHWPRDSVLADVVAVIRDFRPDLIVSVFSGTERDGHGQHQAAGILAREGFAAAGDPARFREQIERGLRPHAPSRLYQALWGRDDGADLRLSTGEIDPLFGLSHYQIAMASRSRHRSQDMGRVLTPGPQASAFSLVAGDEPPNGAAGLFAGLDTALAQRARSVGNGGEAAAALAAYQAAVERATAAYHPFRPGELVPVLAEALGRLDAARSAAAAEPEIAFHLAAERADIERAIFRAAGLVLDAVSEDEAVAPGQEVAVEATLWNGGDEPVRISALEPLLPAGWTATPLDPLPAEAEPGALVRRRFSVRVPPDAPPTEPYFLRSPRAGDLYDWPEDVQVGVPFEPPAVRVRASVAVAAGAEVGQAREATYREVDKMQGELRRPVRVVPLVSVLVDPALAVLRTGAGADEPLGFSVRVRAEALDGIRGVLRPELPAGWRAVPAEVPLAFTRAGEERVVAFAVHPPENVGPGRLSMRVPFVADSGERFERGFTLVDYPHTRPRPLFAPASAALQAIDVRIPEGLRVGYIAGPGDEIEPALRRLGLDVHPLGPAELAAADLSGFDVVVAGIRAYEVRPDLVAHNQRLLDYVRAGGTFIVQYNKYEYVEPGIAPYPVRMSRPHDRVTDETAPVRILEPANPVFTGPNRITSADFDGWVQERGLYFLSGWDGSFTPLLEMADPGEDPLRGALLVAPYGEGTYVYTGLSFFRQLPAGVPGAYRLLANLIALGADR